MVPNRAKHQSCFLYCGCTTFHFPKRFSEPPRKSKFSDLPQQIFSDFQNFLKLVSAIFIRFLFFHQMIALLKLWKMFFISSKRFLLFLRYLNFWKIHVKNVHQKVAPDTFLILLNNPKQSLHARNSLTNKVFWRRIIKKP